MINRPDGNNMMPVGLVYLRATAFNRVDLCGVCPGAGAMGSVSDAAERVFWDEYHS